MNKFKNTSSFGEEDDRRPCINAPSACPSSPAAADAPNPLGLSRRNAGAWAFTLVEVLTAISITAIGFLGTFALVLQTGKMVSAAEEDADVGSGIEQRMDQLRTLSWTQLTDETGAGVTTNVWTAAPASLSGITVTQEKIIVSPYGVAADSYTGTWDGSSAPVFIATSGGQVLSNAKAVKVSFSLTWTGRRSSRAQTRTLVTIISEGGISKSVIP